jgi:hypothetical protein
MITKFANCCPRFSMIRYMINNIEENHSIVDNHLESEFFFQIPLDNWTIVNTPSIPKYLSH